MIGATLLLAIQLVVGSSITGTAEELKTRWLNEYPSAAAALETSTQNFVARGTHTYRYLNGDKSSQQLTVAALAGQKLIIRNRRKFEPSDRPVPESDVYCWAQSHAFKLKKETKNDPYVIEYYGKEINDATSFVRLWEICIIPSTTYMQKPLIARMKAPTFAVKDIMLLNDGGEELVRVRYSCDHEGVSETGTVDLDVARNWAIRKVDVVANSKGFGRYEYKADVDYGERGNGRVLPDKNEYTFQTSKPNIYEHVLVAYDHVSGNPAQPEMFKLTGYGLPDVPLDPQPTFIVFSFRSAVLWGSLLTCILTFGLLWATRPRSRGKAERGSASPQ